MPGAGIGLFQVACRGQGGAAPFSPLSLFASGEEGGIYDFQDLSSMFQDDAATIPVTAAGQSVGYVADQTGNGRHLIQSTIGFRPILRETGGVYWLEGDGVDDRIGISAASQTVMQTATRISYFAALQGAEDADRPISSHVNANYSVRATNPVQLNSVVGTSRIINRSVMGGDMDFTVASPFPNNGYVNSATAQTSGTNAAVPGLLSFTLLGQRLDLTAGNHAGGVYGAAMYIHRLLTPDERSSIIAWIAGKAGVTLP